MGSASIDVDYLKNPLWHTSNEGFHQRLRDVGPAPVDGITKFIHSRKLITIFINISCHPSPHILYLV